MKIEKDKSRKNVFIVTDIKELVEEALAFLNVDTSWKIDHVTLIDLKMNLIVFKVVNALPVEVIAQNIDAAMSAPIVKIEKEYLRTISVPLYNDIYFTINVIDVDNHVISYAVM